MTKAWRKTGSYLKTSLSVALTFQNQTNSRERVPHCRKSTTECVPPFTCFRNLGWSGRTIFIKKIPPLVWVTILFSVSEEKPAKETATATIISQAAENSLSIWKTLLPAKEKAVTWGSRWDLSACHTNWGKGLEQDWGQRFASVLLPSAALWFSSGQI